MKRKILYRVIFKNEERIYEIYARKIEQRDFFGFIAIEGLLFGETSSIVVDASQERLKSEFEGVTRTYIPLHFVIRIDQVERIGSSKVTPADKEGNVSRFPTSIYTKTPENVN